MNEDNINHTTESEYSSTKSDSDRNLVEQVGFAFTGSVKITDADTSEVLLHTRIDT
jgi:hypothetical protein